MKLEELYGKKQREKVRNLINDYQYLLYYNEQVLSDFVSSAKKLVEEGNMDNITIFLLLKEQLLNKDELKRYESIVTRYAKTFEYIFIYNVQMQHFLCDRRFVTQVLEFIEEEIKVEKDTENMWFFQKWFYHFTYKDPKRKVGIKNFGEILILMHGY